MLPLLLVLALLGAVYLFSQQTSADAPGHCGGMTAEMGTKLNYDDISILAQNAGFGLDSGTATAIALAESKGETAAYNKESQDVPGRYNRVSEDDGLGSVGLWQIYLAAHKELAGMDLTDPQTNANEAYVIYANAGGFHPWSTFKNGDYQNFMAA